MQIIIDNKVAAIKAGSSFEYVSENRLFGGGDDYTFAITLPLAGCTVNQRIFGHINRADVVAGRIRFDCEIRCASFTKFGTATITEITEQNVKLQFLAGRSEQNFDNTWDKVYINELRLGSPPTTDKTAITPANAWSPEFSDLKYVALPWVNDYSRNIQNKANHIVDDETQKKSHFEWSEDTTGLSWQPYLLWLTKKICEALPNGGYQYDFSKWEAKEEYKYLLVCNTLPHAWYMPGFAAALPHWSVKEYFEKLELFLDGEFEIDHRAKKVSFAFTRATLESLAPVSLENVVDEHTTTIKAEDGNCEYREMKNLVYKDCDHRMWKFYSCDWFIKGHPFAMHEYKTMSELVEQNKKYSTWDGGNESRRFLEGIFHAADCDAYFLINPIRRTISWDKETLIRIEYKCRLQPVNLFGGRIVDDSDNAESEEIEFVPAWIDDTDKQYGRVLFLHLSDYDEETDTSTAEDEGSIPFRQTLTVSTLDAGQKEKTSEYYDRIYIGWYNGSNYFTGSHLPYPNVDDVVIDDDNWSNFAYAHFSLRLNNARGARSQCVHKLDPKTKTTFKFLSDTIPDVRAVFYIQGKRYICEKITATFTDGGMSRLMKGEFWPLVDD